GAVHTWHEAEIGRRTAMEMLADLQCQAIVDYMCPEALLPPYQISCAMMISQDTRQLAQSSD
ncbi:hypothetical protein AA309_23780, partial [Microvirga vignae]